MRGAHLVHDDALSDPEPRSLQLQPLQAQGLLALLARHGALLQLQRSRPLQLLGWGRTETRPSAGDGQRHGGQLGTDTDSGQLGTDRDRGWPGTLTVNHVPHPHFIPEPLLCLVVSH